MKLLDGKRPFKGFSKLHPTFTETPTINSQAEKSITKLNSKEIVRPTKRVDKIPTGSCGYKTRTVSVLSKISHTNSFEVDKTFSRLFTFSFTIFCARGKYFRLSFSGVSFDISYWAWKCRLNCWWGLYYYFKTEKPDEKEKKFSLEYANSNKFIFFRIASTMEDYMAPCFPPINMNTINKTLAFRYLHTRQLGMAGKQLPPPTIYKFNN